MPLARLLSSLTPSGVVDTSACRCAAVAAVKRPTALMDCDDNRDGEGAWTTVSSGLIVWRKSEACGGFRMQLTHCFVFGGSSSEVEQQQQRATLDWKGDKGGGDEMRPDEAVFVLVRVMGAW